MKPEMKVFSLRTATETYARLGWEADQLNASINQLINEALNAYFDDEWNPDKVFASRHLFGVMKIVANAMQAVGATALHLDTGSPINAREWYLDSYAYDQAVRAAIAVLEHYRPPGRAEPSHPSIDTRANEFKLRVGEVTAGDLLAEVDGSEEVGSVGERLRRDLDPRVLDNVRNRTGGEK